MNTKVTVLADVNGNAVTISEKNPDFSHIRVGQTVLMYDENGWLKKKELSALVHGDTETMLAMGYEVGQELNGSIIVKESLSPFGADGDRDLKIAGATGIVCRVDDQPIYRKTFYSESPNAQHELIAHTNRDEIRTAGAIERSAAQMLKSLSGVSQFETAAVL